MNVKDLTGQRFGRLVAMERTREKDRSGKCFLWRCACDCGREALVSTNMLTGGLKRSCGCLQDENRRADITGRRVGKLTAIKALRVGDDGDTIWLWRCDCGAEIEHRPISSNAAGNITRTMCDDCSLRLKMQQAEAARTHIDIKDGINFSRLRSTMEKNVRGDTSGYGASGYRGVSWHQRLKKYQARITINGKTLSLGSYAKLEDAVEARMEAERLYFGEALEDRGE